MIISTVVIYRADLMLWANALAQAVRGSARAQQDLLHSQEHALFLEPGYCLNYYFFKVKLSLTVHISGVNHYM